MNHFFLALTLVYPSFLLAQAPAGDDSADPYIDTMIAVGKPLCDEFVPGFLERTSSSYASWRESRSTFIDAHEDHIDYQGNLNNSRQKILAAKPHELERFENECDRIETDLNSFQTTANIKLQSPSSTWELYIDSLRLGEANIAVSCLTGPARDNYRRIFENATHEELTAIADDMVEFSMTTQAYGEFREAVVTTRHGKSGIVTFYQNKKGEWKIYSM